MAPITRNHAEMCLSGSARWQTTFRRSYSRKRPSERERGWTTV